MPNESVPICGCGVTATLEICKGNMRNVGTSIPSNKNCLSKHNSSSSKFDARERKNHRVFEESSLHQQHNHHHNHRRYNNQETAGTNGGGGGIGTTGSTSSVQQKDNNLTKHQGINPAGGGGGGGKRINSSRRTRSAERPDSHYTYIDSGSSVVSNVTIRENVIPEALYATINNSPDRNVNANNHQVTNHSQTPAAVYAIPSMTSPPPTYDVAMWQSGLPPSYEEYLCHKYAVISRSHTPPPPWSDSSSTIGNNSQHQHHQLQSRREILASQPDLREYLNQLAKAHAQLQSQSQSQSQTQSQSKSNKSQSQNNNRQQRVVRESTSSSSSSSSSSASNLQNTNLQISARDQAVRSQRARTTISRSQSESRARQQRIATMYEDGAFCMETTAIQSAFEHGVAFCSLM